MQFVLVDDCSPTAMTDEVRRLVQDHDIEYLRHRRNQGLAAARNTAISAAKGRYFAFCDDDDAWPPGFAARLVSAVDALGPEPGLAIALSPRVRDEYRSRFDTPSTLRELMLGGITPPVGSQIYATSLLERCGGYDSGVRSGVDHDLWFRLAPLDPPVTVAWGDPAIVSSETGASRMTTREAERRRKVEDALARWEPSIRAAFPPGFREHVERCYGDYLDYRFFRLALARRDWGYAIELLRNRRVGLRFADDVLRRLRSRPRLSVFPSFTEGTS